MKYIFTKLFSLELRGRKFPKMGPSLFIMEQNILERYDLFSVSCFKEIE